jgi:hypothetical protein
MSVSFTRTRTEIAQRVLGKVTKLGSTTMDADEAALVYEALDLRLKEMHKLGTFWRKVTSVPVTFSLAAGIASASAGAGDILFPLKVTFTNGTQDDPVYIMGPKEYAAIPDKNIGGNPTKVLWKGGTEFLFYPVPSSQGTAKLLYEKIADDTSAGAAIDIDVSMIRAMIDIIKYDVADDFGINEATQNRWRGEARMAEIDIRKLGALRVDYSPVAVDDFDGRANSTRPSGGYVNNDYIE